MAGGGGARPGAGRPKGSVNRLAKEFAEKFDAACLAKGFNLIESIVDMCNDENKELALKAQTLVMPYRYPKLRHVEITSDQGEYQPVFKLIVESEKEEKK